MTQLTDTSITRKKNRLKINNITDFNRALVQEGNTKINTEESKFKNEISQNYNLDKAVVEVMYEALNNEEITYRADNIVDFIEYMKNINTIKNEHEKLTRKIKSICKLNIERIEYEREVSIQDNVDHILNDIEIIKNKVSKKIDPKEIYKLEKIEKQLDKDYIYSKDIDLLKKMITTESSIKKESYNQETKTKTLSLEIPNDLNLKYIPAKLGSIEYHQHIKNNIPRMKRLRKNIKKYLETNTEEYKTFKINQSATIQDTVNIAVATYDNKEFKAISGSNDVAEFCSTSRTKYTAFASHKVNKVGKIGIGYNRVNDSEKKILEEIHRQIIAGKIKNYGNLVLYSKWEPCPSCYYVISQFCKEHPKINFSVKYIKEYGE